MRHILIGYCNISALFVVKLLSTLSGRQRRRPNDIIQKCGFRCITLYRVTALLVDTAPSEWLTAHDFTPPHHEGRGAAVAVCLERHS